MHRFRSEEEGFTLVELLVVILIIGILAAVALPSFLGQQKKGQNADSKSNARNAISQMESCYADNQTYVGCDTGQGDLAQSGLPLGTGQGQVSVSSITQNGYVVTGQSKSGCNFIGTKTGGAAIVKTTNANAGCSGATSW